jgi:hypothetical protein
MRRLFYAALAALLLFSVLTDETQAQCRSCSSGYCQPAFAAPSFAPSYAPRYTTAYTTNYPAPNRPLRPGDYVWVNGHGWCKVISVGPSQPVQQVPEREKPKMPRMPD